MVLIKLVCFVNERRPRSNAHTLVEKVDAEGRLCELDKPMEFPARPSLVKTNHVVNLRDCKKNSEHQT